jgi:proteic killer suppression protein/toxin YoeB
LNIRFENSSVEKYFKDFNYMSKEKGENITRAIKKRYDQLKAANNFSIYLQTGLGKPHPLHGNLKGCYGISITGNLRLIVRPDVQSIDPGSLKECDTVIIKGVLDYHGKKYGWIIP